MDKQKQIEEMAQCKNNFGFTCGGDCTYKTSACERYKLAEELYNAGYRKIPENAVVLTKEEYDELDKCRWNNTRVVELLERFDEKLKEACKETAEKFAERVKMAFYYEFDELIPSIMADKIDEICKEITDG